MIDINKRDLTFNALEFEKILAMLSEYTHTAVAKEQAHDLCPMLSIKEVNNRLNETTQARRMLDGYGTPPFVSMENVSAYIEIADKEGILTAEQLAYIEITLTAVRRLKDYLNRCKQMEISLAYYDVELDEMEDLQHELSQKIRNQRVDDYASKLLKDTRQVIEKAENAMQLKVAAVMKANKNSLSDQFSTMRNGHCCIPVKKECKYQIPGTMYDQSSSGATVFIEPASVGKYYEELEMLRLTEENEVRRILYTLTVMVAERKEIFAQNEHIIDKLDFIFAKAMLSAQMDAIAPNINQDRYIKIKNGRHPLLKKDICVPLQFEIGNDIRGIIITGPNTGGKTVAIKTVGLLSLMAQCGLHVPAEEANLTMNSQILCDIGDGQDINQNLSTFSAHITNALQILERLNSESLIIMDELGSGTDPAEGMGIAIAILEQLRKSGCLFLVTTHYPEVKNYAAKEEGVMNARMAFDRESLQPLYNLKLGEAGESCALYIAKKLGMPTDMLLRAQIEAYGGEREGLLTEEEKAEALVNTQHLKKKTGPRIQKEKKDVVRCKEADSFNLGDSIMLYPDKKIGIVCEKANDKGILRIQLQKKKIYVNYKRVKLLVAATELYPDNYDFSIVFDSVAVRKARHQMSRKYCGDMEICVTMENDEKGNKN